MKTFFKLTICLILIQAALLNMERVHAQEKPQVTSKIIEVLEANKDSSDKDLQMICRAKLMQYSKK